MRADDFCRRCFDLIGKPYTQIDCIGVVRTAAGIRCQGTNWLWRSYNSRGKYQYLIERLDRAPELSEIRDGLLVFRIAWYEKPSGYDDRPNCYHVGVIYGGKVIQSQEKSGVYMKDYNPGEWQGAGWLKMIEPTPNGGTADAVRPNTDHAAHDSDLPFTDTVEDPSEKTIDDKINEIYQMVKSLYDKVFPD